MNNAVQEPSACKICGGSSVDLRNTGLGTCEDLMSLGAFRVFRCRACDNAFTFPLPQDAITIPPPDVHRETLTYLERHALRWFMDVRVNRIATAIGGLSGKQIMDVGGGGCAFANALAFNGARVVVVEPNEGNRGQVGPGVKFVAASLSDDLLKSGVVNEGSFDALTFWHSLEHVTDPCAVLGLAKRLLKQGGCLYISVPNLDSFQALLGGNRWAYLDVPRHISHFTVRGLRRVLEQQGFADMEFNGWSVEHELFGIYQTLLNRMTCSHNYFYNRAKKGNDMAGTLRFPVWTRLVTSIGPLLLPLVGLLALLSWLIRKPVCVEVACWKAGRPVS